MYSNEFKQEVMESNYYKYTPQKLIDEWQEFLVEIEDGYQFIPPELDNDLYIREQIDGVLQNERLWQFLEFEMFKNEIEAIDTTFKAHCYIREDMPSRPWWNRVILKHACKDYANFMQKYLDHGMEIEIDPDFD